MGKSKIPLISAAAAGAGWALKAFIDHHDHGASLEANTEPHLDEPPITHHEIEVTSPNLSEDHTTASPTFPGLNPAASPESQPESRIDVHPNIEAENDRFSEDDFPPSVNYPPGGD